MALEIKVDMKRRENLRRLHTATHILNYSAKKILGNHIWQNGSNLKENSGTLDITHYEIPNREQISEIEDLSNKIIFDNVKVTIEEEKREVAEKKYGFTLYQGGIPPLKNLRVVNVGNLDVEACGGIHMSSTGGIGLIKIISVSRVQDGVMRITFCVHNFALNEIKKRNFILEDAAKVLSVKLEHLPNSVLKFFNQVKSQKKQIEILKKAVKNLCKESIFSQKQEQIEIKGDIDMGLMQDVFSEIIRSDKISKLTIFCDFFILSTEDNIKGEFKKVFPRDNFCVYIKK